MVPFIEALAKRSDQEIDKMRYDLSLTDLQRQAASNEFERRQINDAMALDDHMRATRN